MARSASPLAQSRACCLDAYSTLSGASPPETGLPEHFGAEAADAKDDPRGTRKGLDGGGDRNDRAITPQLDRAVLLQRLR